MKYYKEYTLKNGEILVVRTAEKYDSKDVADVVNITHGETNNLGFSNSERFFTADDELEYIENMNNTYGSILLIAEYKNQIVATSQIIQKSKYNWKKHICDFGIAVEKKCWGLGIAGKLMLSIIECAKQMKYEQMELTVVAENTRAFELYKSFGFELCGTIKNAYKFSKTHYSDGYIMQKFLE